MLYLVLSEPTPNLEIYNWMQHIQKASHESEKSPFANSDRNALTLILKDTSDKDIREFTFAGLSIKDHECVFETDGFLHSITIEYDSLKISETK